MPRRPLEDGIEMEEWERGKWSTDDRQGGQNLAVVVVGSCPAVRLTCPSNDHHDHQGQFWNRAIEGLHLGASYLLVFRC